jgi:hypothetical protein
MDVRRREWLLIFDLTESGLTQSAALIGHTVAVDAIQSSPSVPFALAFM